ncbi:PepSY-associated TM helix domain-containing protein [Sphingomonas sp. Leaf257]|uniref:PepSY-associated TM helix domain-containing protein n=1 Tax=Sphingomonas sp. Leaf257 TaxID=1736309 RepID=UPI0009EA032B|nr:PepSY-associated TM helix domain-containing protein [Sphingomonas sp. Leaf257]
MAGISLRDTALQVHRWLGLAIGLIAIVLAISGAILAASPMLERIANPARFRISGEQRQAASLYSDAAHRRLRPGERIAALSLEQGSSPVIVTLKRTGNRTDDRAQRLLFLDPPTGQVLASGWKDGGVIGAARRVHDGLFLSGLGRWIVGLGGIGLVLASLTGLWAQATRERPKASAKRPCHESRWTIMHRRVGLWSAIPVLALTATGLAIVPAPGMISTPAAPPVTRAALPVDRVVASAKAWTHGTLRTIDWPTERSPDWILHFEGGEPSVVKVADDSAKALAAPAYAGPVMLSWVRRWHGGQGMPWIWWPLAALTGLLAAWVAATGLIAWGRRPKVRRARR